MSGNGTCLRSIAIITAILVVVTLAIVTPPAKAAPDAPTTVKIITPNNRARLCPKPNCGENEQLTHIPTGTKLKIDSSISQSLPMWDVIWYKVTFKGKQGWVSEFNTDAAPAEPRYR